MHAKQLVIWEIEALIVVALIGLFVWRYWFMPETAAAPPKQEQPSAPAPLPSPTPGVTVTPAKAAPAEAPTSAPRNLLIDGSFATGLAYWAYWKDARAETNAVKVVKYREGAATKTLLRIENPLRKMIGVQQAVPVKAGGIYRLGASVRSTAAHDQNILFGGRVAFYLPQQSEAEIVWMTEYNQWWPREMLITNYFDGMATVYVHMGYGGVASTGEFTNIRLEQVR